MYGEDDVRAAIAAGTGFVVEVLGDDDNVDDVCTFAEFAEQNEDEHLLAQVAMLAVGQTYRGGGGAAAEFAVRRGVGEGR